MTVTLGRRHVLPLGVLVFCGLLNLASEPGQVVVGVFAMAPLVAAAVLGRRATSAYAVAAVVLSALIGVVGHQYTGGLVVAQSLRLLGVAVGGCLALFACTLRLRGEAALTRLSIEAAEARSAVRMATTLQRALLTDPPVVPGLEIAVRYLPAVQHAQVGGDWYDAFPGPDGTTMLVIGDVAGHDVAAAATMAQARGVLRGIAQTVAGSPAAVLCSLDLALERLSGSTVLTATVATVQPDPDGGPARLRWSNAGHPAPVLLCADGQVQVLACRPELLLGTGSSAPRSDHEADLARGDTLLLYTDGLIERRGTPLDEGTAWLVQALAGLAGQPLGALCDALLEGMAGRVPDDVAVLAVRIA